jgi:LCP family protein required for cell wall assembly
MNRTTGLILGIVGVAVLAGLALVLVLGGEPEPEPSPSPSPSVEPSSTPEPSPSIEAFNEELLNERLTVLLVGLDMNEQREAPGIEGNTDVLMLASVSADQSEIVLISLPRDTVDVPLADGSVWRPKINGLFAERGIDELVGAMSALHGVPIDGYVMIDMDDFAALVDAVDGVTVNPPAPIVDPPIGLNIQPGEQVLDGPTALSYVRSRLDQDYGRMGRQQEVITELVARLVDPEADVDLADLLDGLESLETDLPLADLRTLAELARRAQGTTVTRELVDPPDLIVREGDLGDVRGYILVPDVAAIRALATSLIPPEE